MHFNRRSHSQEEPPPRRFHGVPLSLDDPVVIAELGVEGPLLQRPELQREPRAHLSQADLLGRLEIVPGTAFEKTLHHDR